MPQVSRQPIHMTLGIAEIIVSDKPVVISTVLGSCISVCIYSIKGTVGGMNHFALPIDPKNAASKEEPFRYGESSLKAMIDAILSTPGVQRNELRAKIIGGSALHGEETLHSDIGAKNVQLATQFLKRNKIEIAGTDIGGSRGRKIFFYTDSGKVRICTIQTEHAEQDLKRSLTLANKHMTSALKPRDHAVPVVKPKVYRVLIVDDSKSIQDSLNHIISQDPQLKVIGMATNGVEAEKFLAETEVDVITLDIQMPVMDGPTLLGRIMDRKSMPIVMMSSMDMADGDQVLRCLELGAVDCIQKPRLNELAQTGPIICEKIKAAASAHVRITKHAPNRMAGAPKVTLCNNRKPMVVIGSSTGGTQAIRELLLQLPAEIPPILIVQHIPKLFSLAYAKRLNELCSFEVKEAEHGDRVMAGRVLIAPGGLQMSLDADGFGYKVKICDSPPVNRHKPSVDVLFKSVASLARGHAVGIILTGMGSDGAKGMLSMRNTGCYTFAQDEKSCVVFGMPKEAILLGAVDEICDLSDIPKRLELAMKLRKFA